MRRFYSRGSPEKRFSFLFSRSETPCSRDYIQPQLLLMNTPSLSLPKKLQPLGATLLLLWTWLVLFAGALCLPPNWMDNDQERPLAYVADVLYDGEWLVQRDQTGGITSKPPLYTWTVAALVLARGGDFDALAVYLPTGVAVLATALLVFRVGWMGWGLWAGLLGGLMFLCSGPAFKMAALARTDPFFSSITFAGAVVGWFCLRGRLHWIWFWVLATLSTLAKTPLGLVLMAGGLLVLVPRLWQDEWGQSEGLRRMTLGRGRDHGAGLLLLVAVAGGWFVASLLADGAAVYEKMIGDELVGHAVESGSGQRPFEGFLKPSAYFVTRYFPWSLLAVMGLVRVLRSSDGSGLRPGQLLLGRYLAAYFLAGLFIFSASPHQRSDHLLPLIPAAALLAALEAIRWLPRPPAPRWITAFAGGIVVLMWLWVAANHLLFRDSHYLIRTRWATEFGHHVVKQVGPDFPLISADMPYAMQFAMGTNRDDVPREWIGEALASDSATFVLVRDFKNMEPYLPGQWYQVAAWPDEERAFLQVLSNRPKLAWQEQMVSFAGTVRVRTHGLRPAFRGNRDIFFDGAKTSGFAVLRNLGKQPATVRVGFDDGFTSWWTLEPGERRYFPSAEAQMLAGPAPSAPTLP